MCACTPTKRQPVCEHCPHELQVKWGLKKERKNMKEAVIKYKCNMCESFWTARDVDDEYMPGTVIKSYRRIKDKPCIIICDSCERIISKMVGKFDLEIQTKNAIKCMQEHTAGVQRVYDLFSKICDADFLRDFEAKKRDIEYELKTMKAQINECLDFMQRGYKKISSIDQLYSLSKLNSDLVEKVAKVVKIVRDDSDD